MRSEAPTTARHLQHVLCAPNPVNISSFFRECGKSEKGIDCPRHTASGSNAHVASPVNGTVVQCMLYTRCAEIRRLMHYRQADCRRVGSSAVGSQGGNSLTHGA